LFTVARSHLARHSSPAVSLTTSTGSAFLSLADNVITGNSANPAVDGNGSAAYVRATGNRTYGYATALRQLNGAFVHSAGDNYGRAGAVPAPTSGTIDTTDSTF
jgi:hypothetical protein